MSTGLDFYSISWDSLEKLVGSRNRRQARAIIEAQEETFSGAYSDALFAQGPTFDEGVHRWIQGDLGKPGTGCQVNDLGDALAFVAIVRHLGRRTGELSSAGTGERLVDSFLGRKAAKSLSASWPMEHLISRPILGFERIHAPTWGGLSRTELSALATALAGDPPEDPGDPDQDGWYLDLWNALGGACDAGLDLITIYG